MKQFLTKISRNLTALCCLLICINEAGASEQNDLSLNAYTLDKVLIFSRHGLRSPVEKDPEEMAKYSPYSWAKWDVPSGYLTAKGTILETYFGQYLGQWLKQNGLLTAERCASGEGIFAYANSVQRTIATGQALIAGAFAGCHVPLQHQGEIGRGKDPVFHAQARNPDITLIEFAKKNIDLVALQQKLAPNYALLSELIDYKHSPNCLQKGDCDLGGKQGEYSIQEGKSVRITGSISTAKKIVSSLLLAHYVGKSPNEIANGNIDSAQKWQAINEIKNEYYRTLFKNNRELAQNVAYPLLQFIQQQLNSENKISLLVGHDSNIVALLAALGVEPYELENSLENIPIGGKLMFEVWKHHSSGKRQFRLEYVYQTTEQLINLTPLSLSTPPNRTRLTLADCSPDDEGLCDYERFQQVLQDSLKVKTEK
ncbi:MULTISPECIES: histidine-type phosphatase [unclassified Pasteurella]|uniref:histidine-type phosphatase n=1 Tax=unclassified Pasteurella TaxID=2621516 RepID=UPI00107426B1|nr:histidine-type phosphatase [Pasteurella sp. 19428wF3_WM03]TFU53234.1 histidine-type phosphatase [Pasteurella sp. WM03]